MLVSIVDNAYPTPENYPDRVLRMKAQGYQAVDFQALAHTDTALWKLPEPQFLALVKNTGDFLRQQGLQIAQAHAPMQGGPTGGTPEARQRHFEEVHKALKGCQALGCHLLAIHPLLPFGNDPAQDPDAVLGINMGFLGKAADYARFYNVTLCLENLPHDHFPLSTPESVRNLVEDMDLPNLKVCLDTGHCAMRGFPPGDAVRLIGPRLLQCLHVHDNDGHHDSHLPPGEGVIDWNDFRQALQDIHFQGALNLECNPKTQEQEIQALQMAQWLAGGPTPPPTQKPLAPQ